MSTMDTYSDPQPRVRPRALTVICVLAIVFGALGLLAGCFGLISQVASSAIQQAVVSGQAGAGAPAAGAQTEMITKTMAIASKYNPIMIPLTILRILVEGALLIGGIMALSIKATGRTLLVNGLIAAAILESISFVPRYMIQKETQVVTAELMPQIMAAQQGANAVPPGFDMSAMMSGIGTVALVLGLFWLIAKIVVYILGIRYLRDSKVMQLFSSAADSGRY